MRHHGLAALLGVLVASVAQAPKSARAAVTLEATGPAAPAVIERALVLHDAQKGQQQLVQEFTFPAGDTPLGLLLPVPARPTVSKLANSPFAKLAAASAAAAAAAEGGSGFGSSGPEGLTSNARSAPSADASEPVQLGRLSTSVIAASDAKAVKQWLTASKLGTDAATDAWLASYAARGFYFVAVRVAPAPSKDAHRMVTETLQISFASALPYVPYAEASEDAGLRLLSVWVLSSYRYVPVTLALVDIQSRWLRPWRELDASRPSLQDLKGLLPKSLLAQLPKGPENNAGLVRYREHQLQHFEDQKSARLRAGDVVLLREEGGGPPDAELRRMMSVLDPEVKP